MGTTLAKPDDADIASGKYGIWWSNTNNMNTPLQLVEDENFDIMAITVAVVKAGDEVHFINGSSTRVILNGCAVSTYCEDSALACRLINYFYSADG